MKQYHASFAAKAQFLVAIAAAFVCTTANSVRAQQAAPPQDLTLREHQMSQLEREKIRKRSPKEVLAEVNEDMSRLRMLNEGISTHAAATDQQLNYKSIVENVAEVKKRSTRLSIDLALPKEEKEAKRVAGKDAEKGALQPALAALNKLLDSFLNNPIFSDAGAIDLQLAAKARRDLDDIIVLSDKLRKSADKRSKDGVKAP
jgi:hypothetical protein